MGMLSDLKFQLKNRNYIDSTPEIWFPKPLKVKLKGVECEDCIEYVGVKKTGRSIKLFTINDCVTLSALDNMLQWYVFCTLRSMTDSRYPFDFEKVYEVESIFSKRD